MKQKNTKYLLIAIVTLIWSIIIYKVVNAIGQNGPITSTVNTKEYAIDRKPAGDSFSLYANYPDPFIPDADTSLHVEVAKGNTVLSPGNQPVSGLVANSHPIKPDPSTFIKYHGMVYNPEKKIKAALLTINSKEITLKEKEMAENVTIKKILTDRIQVLYNHKIYTIFRLN